jgi:hypothetical protein
MDELTKKMAKWNDELIRQEANGGIRAMVQSMMADYGELYRENQRLKANKEKTFKTVDDMMDHYGRGNDQ